MANTPRVDPRFARRAPRKLLELDGLSGRVWWHTPSTTVGAQFLLGLIPIGVGVAAAVPTQIQLVGSSSDLLLVDRGADV